MITKLLKGRKFPIGKLVKKYQLPLTERAYIYGVGKYAILMSTHYLLTDHRLRGSVVSKKICLAIDLGAIGKKEKEVVCV